MVTIRSSNEIIANLQDFFRLVQPDLDVKVGTVARNLMIDAPSNQLSLLYDELSGVSNKQSIRLVIGSDLDKLAKNFGITRKQATPATGVAVITFPNISATININPGDTMIANNGFSFSVVSGLTLIPAASNLYKSIAAKYRDQLDFAGISDQYAMQISVVATTAGSAGNIATYSLLTTSISGISNVTNIASFLGGNDQEGDAAFRNRVLAAFSGSSVGTTLGYLNVALGTTGVSDSAIIGPGDPLMTRDGTQTKINSDGSSKIISEGTGGKVDVIVLGSNLLANTDSYIYQDKSNKNDPTNSKNNIVLGQIPADLNKTINRKRIDDIANNQLPSQPVDSITTVSGSLSGSNFVEKSTNSFGIVSGNFELIKDTGVYGGSPWGFDTFHWISNKITNFQDNIIKGQFNGQDSTNFTDVLDISKIEQNLSITNENSIVNSSDRSLIQLLHTPIINVTRVYNVNTGERYIVTNQNFNNTSPYNNTGIIQISGNTLPSPSDTLQVDYEWIINFDPYSDFDGLVNTYNPRTVDDSVDWGYSNVIRNENVEFNLSIGNNYFIGNTKQPISNIINISQFINTTNSVYLVTSGPYVNRLAININNLSAKISSIDSIVNTNSNIELFNTSQKNGSFSTFTSFFGIQIVNNAVIILPTDTTAVVGDIVTCIINKLDLYKAGTSGTSFNNFQITVPSILLGTSATTITLDITYLANVSTLFSSGTTSLPSSKLSNGYLLNNNVGGTNFSPVNLSNRENQIVQKNGSQYYIEININNIDYSLTTNQVVAVIRLSDSKILWDFQHQGTLSFNGINNNYQIILSGYNTPVLADRIMVVYYCDDLRKFQPFTYQNSIIHTRLQSLTSDISGKNFQININNFVTQSSVSFQIVDANDNIIYFSGNDGYINASNPIAFFGSLTSNFATLPDINYKKIIISNSAFNNGEYDIIEYNSLSNILTITNSLNKLNYDQVSIIRLLDNKEIFNYSSTIDLANNNLLIPITPAAQLGDEVFVMFYNFKNLKQSLTKLSSNLTDQIVNPGILTFSGTTVTLSQDIIFTATNSGLKINSSEAIRKSLGLTSNINIPNSLKLAKIAKLEKVTTASLSNDEVLNIDANFDVFNTTIQNNLLYNDEMLSDISFQNFDFLLPRTSNNIANSINIGDKLRITFYYYLDNDSESLNYSRNGVLYGNKKFAFINKIFVSSGFKNSQSTKLTVNTLTQPILGSRYKAYYDYTAPKINERISISYNFNQLITDVTFNLEKNRPINADVIAKEAVSILLDTTINIVISDNYLTTSNLVLQNLKDKITSIMTTNQLAGTIDLPTIITAAQSISGVARVRVLYFNQTGKDGSVSSITAQENQFFTANNVIINQESR